MAKKTFIGGGMDSVRLLVDDGTLIGNNRSKSFISAGNQSLPLKMKYLRWIYFILTLQFFFISIVSFIIFMLPPVRAYAQQNFFDINWLFPIGVGALFVNLYLLRVAGRKSHFVVVAVVFVVFTALLVAFLAVVAAYCESELVYQLSFLLGTVFLCHAVFCLQSRRDLNVLCCVAASVLASTFAAFVIEFLLSLYSFNYLYNISLATLISTYFHVNIRYFMFRYTVADWHLGCVALYTIPVKSAGRS